MEQLGHKLSSMSGPPPLETGVKYAITINPSNKKQAYGRGINRMRTIYEDIVNTHLLKWKDAGIEYELKWECKLPSHPKPSRYHFHGWIKFNKPVALFVFYNRFWDRMRQDYNTHIEVIKDADKWGIYCNKQLPLMEPMCKHFRVPYPLNVKDIVMVGGSRS